MLQNSVYLQNDSNFHLQKGVLCFVFFLEAQLNENCYFFTFQQVEKTVEMLKIERCVVNKGKNNFLTVLKNSLFLYFLYEVVDLRFERA